MGAGSGSAVTGAGGRPVAAGAGPKGFRTTMGIGFNLILGLSEVKATCGIIFSQCFIGGHLGWGEGGGRTGTS